MLREKIVPHVNILNFRSLSLFRLACRVRHKQKSTRICGLCFSSLQIFVPKIWYVYFVDFSSVSNEAESTDIAEVSLMKFLSSTLLNLLLVSLQVIYVGLHIVTPLISLELLKYPKLSCDYFALVSHLLEVYPEKVAQLNMEAFEHIVRTLDFGVRHQHWRKMLKFKMELAGSAADAILPLVLCEQDLYQ
ncbi:hypothetical protein GW17_00018171, partial [Ensete ventricosum]